MSKSRELILKAQNILAQHLPPDGLSEKEAIRQLLLLFDGPESRAALAATAVPVLSDDVIHALWGIAWNVAIKEAGVCIGNADMAHMRQPVVFARLLSDATAINAAKKQADELRQRNEEGLKQLAATNRSQP